MDSVDDQLNDFNKIEWVIHKLKGSAALSYTIVHAKITTYGEFIKCFENWYWN